jgi:hypothetical protein
MCEQQRVVYGTSWRRHGHRRQCAARIARMLRPVAHVLGGVVSTELTVPVDGRWYRPDVGVLLDRDQPLDGVLRSAPSLVVRLGDPLSGETWLRAGADVVWAVEGGTVWELTHARRRARSAGEWLTHPDELALRLSARELAHGRSAGSAPFATAQGA